MLLGLCMLRHRRFLMLLSLLLSPQLSSRSSNLDRSFIQRYHPWPFLLPRFLSFRNTDVYTPIKQAKHVRLYVLMTFMYVLTLLVL